jgi:poly-gamma-glutamate capsule biosynthesis protein CapA/YwtB (metallophosphatase superfamily)
VGQEFSIVLAGDAILARPWSHLDDADFLNLIEKIRGADVAITNLETVIHEFKGYAQADSGGLHMASHPSIAAELKWAGFDMVAHANNHAFDYGTSGVLETGYHCKTAKLILAGSGHDLQCARAPRYYRNAGTAVALVAMAMDYVSYGKASYTRTDVHGRPGVNPLTVVRERTITVRPLMPLHRLWERYRNVLGVPTWDRFADFQLVASWGRAVDIADAKSNLDAISEAASEADIVIASIHVHRQGSWLARFAHQAIEQGASMVFIHGPHHVRGIELYRGKPIFYSLGNFVFEPEFIPRFPAETYQQQGLAADAPVEKLNASVAIGPSLINERRTFEGVVGRLLMTAGRLDQIQLLPIDLQFDGPPDRRGRPKLASRKLGAQIIARLASRSKKFGTQIVYQSEANWGEVLVGSKTG